MKHIILALTLLPTTSFAWNIEVKETPSPMQSKSTGWEDPVLILATCAVVAFVLAAFAYKGSPNRKFNTAAMVAIGSTLVGAALFWPTYFGSSVPFDALGKVDADDYNTIFLPMFIKAGIAGALGYALARFLVPEDVLQEDPVSQSLSEEPSRPRQLGVGDRIKLYKGYEVIKAEEGVTVDGVHYAGLLAAEKAIDAMEGK